MTESTTEIEGNIKREIKIFHCEAGSYGRGKSRAKHTGGCGCPMNCEGRLHDGARSLLAHGKEYTC